MKSASIILQQLGGYRFQVMTGANRFISHENGLNFRIPKAKDGINFVQIKLNANDLYDVTFWRIRGIIAKEISSVLGAYANDLQSIFKSYTGLDTSLCLDPRE